MQDLAVPLVVAAVLAFVGFRQWLRHQQRVLIHRERLAAIEKGVELPPWPEPSLPVLGMDGLLLLSGLIWLALGVGGMIAAYVIVPQLTVPDAPPPSIALVGLPASLVGLAHLVVYRVHRSRRR
jgi:hypothetical protein